MTWLRTAIGAEGPCVPRLSDGRRSGMLASAAITWRSYREAVVKSRDAILEELEYLGHIDCTS
eukprot:1601329-Pleurochrysis_carterae.AAC.3